MPQDYSGQNLRGRSFRGQNLAGANFSHADIRSADFTKANLTGATFKGAKAGLRKRWAILLIFVSWVLTGVSGFFSAFAGLLIASLVFSAGKGSQIAYQVTACVIAVIFINFFFITIRQGIQAGIVAVVVTIGAGIIAVTVVVTIGAGIIAVTGAVAGAFAFAFVVAVAVAVAGAVAVAVAGDGAFAFAFAVAIAGAGAGAFAFAGTGPVAIALAFGVVVAFAVVLFSAYITLRALKEDPKHALIHNIAIAFAAFKGTNFRNADLTDADFTEATLKSTDFRQAVLTRTCFNKTKKLDRVRPGTSYLQYANLRQILITGQGQEKNFDRFDLRGINLRGAYLADASFIATDLSNANFQDSDLSRAKLVQTQLDGTDFTGATLTGTFIEDWNITHETNFTGVKCEYIYMRLPTRENPDPLRKPDNNQEIFEDGDFGDFIQPIFDTLDLYHNQGVDPRAIAIAFKTLAENNPDAELEIVAMEKRGQDKFLLRAKTTSTANKSELSGEYFDNYNYLKNLPPEEQIKHFLTELKIKDNQIKFQTEQLLRNENMISTALNRPSIQAETYNNQGDTMSQSPKKQSTFNMQGAQVAGGLVDADTVNAHQIGGNITNYTTEQKQNLAQAAAEIQQLLTQLEQTNPTTTSAQKMAVVTKAVDEIEKNPTLKARVVGALKSGGVEALKEALDHPLVNVFIAAVDGWQDAD